VASVKSAAAARAREKEREEEEVGTSFKYELVAPQQIGRPVDTCHKMARLSVVSSAMVRLSHPSPRGVTSVVVHASAPLVTPVRLPRSFINHVRRIDVTIRFKKCFISKMMIKKGEKNPQHM
jgi:hypothetical protein